MSRLLLVLALSLGMGCEEERASRRGFRDAYPRMMCGALADCGMADYRTCMDNFPLPICVSSRGEFDGEVALRCLMELEDVECILLIEGAPPSCDLVCPSL